MKKKIDNNPAHDRVLTKLKENGAVIAAHMMGSGKTVLAWRAADEVATPKGKTLMVVPASLVSNMENAKEEFGFKSKPIILSYEKAQKLAPELAKVNWDLVAFDEAHRLRNTQTDRVENMRSVIAKAKNVLLLTGTPDYNNPEDIKNLISFATKGKVSPEIALEKREIVPSVYDRIFKGSKPTTVEELHISPEAKKEVEAFVHFYDPATSDKAQHFPEVLESKVIVPMDAGQESLYKYFERQLPASIRHQVKNNLPLLKQDAAKFSVFANSFRQLSNGVQGFSPDPEKAPISPKIQVAVERLTQRAKEEPKFRAVVYSNYLTSGIEPYKKELAKTGVKAVEVTGGMSKAEKDAAVKAYNTNKAKVMLISSSGGEGLDLKGTRLVQVLEPHFNASKIKQVIGRGSRFKSHSHLPKEDRNVIVEHYLSRKPSTRDPAIDEYLFNMSLEKHEHGKKVLKYADKE